jgi:hypothetical protein
VTRKKFEAEPRPQVAPKNADGSGGDQVASGLKRTLGAFVE